MVDLSVDLCGLRLRNPFVLASGIWGSCAETLVRVGRAGAGAVTSKSCSLTPRQGHPNPTVLAWGHGLINAVGLSNPGASEERRILAAAKRGLTPLGVPLAASVFGESADHFRRAVEIIAQAEPDLIELNVSCPNVSDEFGLPFALDPDAAAQVTAAVRAVYDGRLFIKLSPGALQVGRVAQAVAAAGADGITAVNTMGPGMIIDVRARRPVLSNRIGGVSGAALRPVALRCVFEIAEAVSLPIIGTGGVASGEDAMAMIMAGATAVGLGSALYQEGEAVFGRLADELSALMQEEGYRQIADFQGVAHAR